MSEEEIWNRIKNRAIDRFTKLVVGFTQRCRKLSLTPEKLVKIIDQHKFASDTEQNFLELAEKFYQSYLEYLEATGEDDFDGLMQKASEAIALGQTVFRRKFGTGDLKRLRYVFIDEYQDFSELFHCLMKAVREQNPQARFFCVGDDWQAINGFAGSNLRFYQDFTQFFPLAQQLTIKVGNQNGRGGSNTYSIRDLLKAEGYRWNTTGWKAWCRTCPAQGFSVHKFLEEALWISRADGIEMRFYDDFENEVGVYCIDKGQWMCILDKFHILE